MRVIISSIILGFSNTAMAQVPMPPVPQEQSAIIKTLEQAYERKDVDLYSRILDENVIVTIDNKIVARSKSEWLKWFGKKLSTNGVIIKINKSYQSSGHLMNIEYFNSVGSFRSQISHCCWSYDAVQYVIESRNIVAINVLSGGDIVE